MKGQVSNLEKALKELVEKNSTALQPTTLIEVRKPLDGRVTDEEHPLSEIFISYAWRGLSEEVTNMIYENFQERGIITILTRDMDYNQDIGQWIINSINRAKAFIVIVSDKYLKSNWCMFEFLAITQKNNFKERTFPVILDDARIYTPYNRLEYIKYWDEHIAQLESDLTTVSLQEALDSFNDELNFYKQIRNNLDEWLRYLSNLNTLTPDMHIESGFAHLVDKIESKLSEKS